MSVTPNHYFHSEPGKPAHILCYWDEEGQSVAMCNTRHDEVEVCATRPAEVCELCQAAWDRATADDGGEYVPSPFDLFVEKCSEICDKYGLWDDEDEAAIAAQGQRVNEQRAQERHPQERHPQERQQAA